MIYATADLHGYPLEAFQRLLKKAHFCEDDLLFVLGDVIDRNGDGGIALLQWMMWQPNVELIMGNHEAMLLSCSFLFEEITDERLDRLDQVSFGAMTEWMQNGAEPTLKALHELRKKDPDALGDLLDYIKCAPYYAIVMAGNREFFLVHSGLAHFEKGKPLSAYSPDDFLWYRPDPKERFFENVITILGYSPTALYGCPDRMFQTPTWIDIDTGAGSGYAPMLLRLDDLTPFYVDEG